LRWSSEFPFAQAQAIEISHIPDYFGTEEVCGMAVTFPFVWFILALPLAWWRRDRAESRRLASAALVLAGYALPVGGLVLCYFSTTMRYQTDYAVALAVLALVGLLALERCAAAWRKGLGALVAGSAAAACLVTVVVGVFVSFDYHGRSMRVTSPLKWQLFSGTTHAVLADVGVWLGTVNGPRELKVRFQARPAGTVETFWRAADPAVDERIVVEHIGEQLIRFGYGRGDRIEVWGRPLRWEPNHTHTVAVQLPSLYAPAGRGWWSGMQRDLQFRERTGVAVWFSGGRALTTIREPRRDQYQAGGAVGSDFSGEIRRASTRLFRPDELPTGLADPLAPRGGVLRLRVIFANDLRAEGEPIFAAGAHYRSNILFAEPVPGGLRLTYENYTFPRVSSLEFAPDPRGHLLELEMASFNPERYGHEATGDVVVRLDGREMIRTRQTAYEFPWGHERIGTNPFGTTCGLEFRGWIVEGRWVR
jgi:hypothetical protein